MQLGALGDARHNGREPAAAAALEEIAAVHSGRGHEIAWQIKPALAGMEGNRAEEPGKRPADTERVGSRRRRLAPHPERLERQGHERGRGAGGVAFEGREIGRRHLLEVLLARLDEAVEVRAREAPALDEVGQRQRHGMAPRPACIDGLDRLAPPLEANAS